MDENDERFSSIDMTRRTVARLALLTIVHSR
jgi:hypothetical protein